MIVELSKYDIVSNKKHSTTILPVLLSIVSKKNESSKTKDLECNGNLFIHTADFIFRGSI